MKQRRGTRNPRRAGDPGEAEARARLEALFARIDRLIPDDLAHIGLEPGRQAARVGARRIAEDAVRRAKLARLAAEAEAAARDRLIERWAAGLFRPTWVGMLNWGVSTGRAEDRAEVIGALEDAALAAVAEGLAPDDVLAALAEDGEAILGMATGGPAEESLAAAVHAVAVARSPVVGIALVVILMLLVAPAALMIGFGGSTAAVSLGVGALVLAGSIAVLVVRRARRSGADHPETA